MKKTPPIIFAASLLMGAATLLFFSAGMVSTAGARLQTAPKRAPSKEIHNYLGFDSNDYPGDEALAALRKTFAFAGYWLNPPPGAKSNSWQGKRLALAAHGFGFLVLFNGRLDRELRSESNAAILAAKDAAAATGAAHQEGFPPGTVIFLDQEEGGRMLPEQRTYIFGWAAAVAASSYRAGIYVSGIPAHESRNISVITANDLHDDAAGKKLIYFVYNDACPPSPGCAFPAKAPAPESSGIPFAFGWQFAQSPRRRALTRSCPVPYDADGNCYAPLLPHARGVFIDVESAASADPSSPR